MAAQLNKTTLALLQDALLLVLPKQAPATHLLQLLCQLEKNNQLPPSVEKQINALLKMIPTLPQFPDQLNQAIQQSGMFLESALLHKSHNVYNDFKGHCFKLLEHLPKDRRVDPNRVLREEKHQSQDHLPLPGAIPQPLHKEPLLNLSACSSEGILHIIREHTEQVISRISAQQINYLMHDDETGFLIMFDLPVSTPAGMDVIPFMIKQHKTEPRWVLSFALNLTHLGNMQVTVAISAKNVDLKINTENEDITNALNNYQQEIAIILAKSGLTLRGWIVKVGLENNQIDVINLRLLDIHI